MALMQKRIASLHFGAELWGEFDQQGFFPEVNELTGKNELQPKLQLERWWIRSSLPQVRDVKDIRRGIVRASLPEILSVAGKRLELEDKKALIKEYTLTRSEKDSLLLSRGNKFGVPLAFRVGWEREIHGPQSPTLEQEAISGIAAGSSHTDDYDTTPTSGNLLVACCGAYSRNASSDSLQVTTSGWTNNIQDDGTNDFGAMQCIASKDAGGSEPTTVTMDLVSSSSRSMVMWIGEYSGMEAASFDVAQSNNDYSAASSISTGTTGTTAQADELALAMFTGGRTGSLDPTSESYDSGSYTEEATFDAPLNNDVSIRVATKILSATGTQECTASWTNNWLNPAAAIATFQATAAGGGSPWYAYAQQ